jgi:hypothetical protein
MCPGNVVSTEATLDVRVGGSFRLIMKGKDKDHVHIRTILRPYWSRLGSNRFGATAWNSRVYAEGVVLLRYPSCMGCEKAVHKADLVSDEKTEAKT